MIAIVRRQLVAPAELVGRFEHVQASPAGHPELDYEVLVAAGSPAETAFELPAAPEQLPPDRPVRLGAYPHPREAGASFDVALYRPSHEVSLVDFLDVLRDSLALEIESADPVAFYGREAVDALVRAGSGARQRIVRLLLVRQGEWVARFGGIAPVASYERLAEEFAVSLSTARFLRPSPEPFLEPFRFSEARGTVRLGLRHPAHWRLRQLEGQPWGHVALELRWIERNDTRACMRVDAIERAAAPALGLQQAARRAEEALWALGLAEARLLAQHPARLFGAAPEPGAVSYRLGGRAFGAEAEVQISALQGVGALYTVATLGPARTADPVAWMAARRAHEIAVVGLNDPEERFVLPPAPRAPQPRGAEGTAAAAMAAAGGTGLAAGHSGGRSPAHRRPEHRPVEIRYDDEGRIDLSVFDELGLDETAAEREIEQFLAELDTEPGEEAG